MEKVQSLELQLAEVEMLQSMYPDEMTIDEPDALSEIQKFVDGHLSYNFLISRVGLTIHLKAENTDEDLIEVVCHLPHEYPSVIPQVFIRCPSLNKLQYKKFSEELQNHISEQTLGEIYLASVIQWIQENCEPFIAASKAEKIEGVNKNSKPEVKLDNKFCRMWIYSHHIYSKIKRKDILDFTEELNLTGFLMSGKPGIICIEGYNNNVEEFWHRIRRMQWKRLVMKEKEDADIGDKDIDSLRKFEGFEEKIFEPRQGKGRGAHGDRGLLFQFLTQVQCEHIFPLFFGVEGKCVVNEDSD